jgi:antitoxin component YwqK of YwqJK toxin-antitoxin module
MEKKETYFKTKMNKDKYLEKFNPFYAEEGPGESYSWYETGELKSSTGKDSKNISEVKMYYTNGKIMSKAQFEVYELTGLAEGWHENGNLYFSGNYNNNKLSGIWTIWFSNGNKKAECEFIGGDIKQGWKTWDDNGKVLKEFKGNSAELMLETKKFLVELFVDSPEFKYLYEGKLDMTELFTKANKD